MVCVCRSKTLGSLNTCQISIDYMDIHNLHAAAYRDGSIHLETVSPAGICEETIISVWTEKLRDLFGSMWYRMEPPLFLMRTPRGNEIGEGSE